MALDDERTWPPDVVEFLKKNEIVLRLYAEAEQKLLDDGAWGPGYVPMALRPPNPHTADWRHILDGLDQLLRGRVSLRGFHCTRLTDREVEAIRANGMTPPDAEMLRKRIEAVRSDGLVSGRMAARLLAENYAAESNRAGRIWFGFAPELLRHETGVGSLLRNWGGEALYALHDRHPNRGRLLRSIGVARIIEAAVPVADLGMWGPEVVVRRFLSARGIEQSALDLSDRTRSPVPAGNIKRIISRSDALFETLTGCSAWRPPLG